MAQGGQLHANVLQLELAFIDIASLGLCISRYGLIQNASPLLSFYRFPGPGRPYRLQQKAYILKIESAIESSP